MLNITIKDEMGNEKIKDIITIVENMRGKRAGRTARMQ